MRESASTDLREPQGSNPLGPPGPSPPSFSLPCLGDVDVCPGEATGAAAPASLSSTRSNWPRSSIVSAIWAARREKPALADARRRAKSKEEGFAQSRFPELH